MALNSRQFGSTDPYDNPSYNEDDPHGLDASIERLANAILKPLPPEHRINRRRPLWSDREPQPGLSAPKRTAPAPVNINQQALPGMEEHAHAGARLLAKGWKLEGRTEWDDGQPYTHELIAHPPQAPGDYKVHARLEWAGRYAHKEYPGEIQMVEAYGEAKGHGAPQALYEMAHDPNVFTGDETVPLHSPVRTNDGYAWSKRVGGFDPDEHNYEDWEHLHPYRQREEALRLAKRKERGMPAIPGQERLSDEPAWHNR